MKYGTCNDHDNDHHDENDDGENDDDELFLPS